MTSADEKPSFDFYAVDLLNFMRYCKVWKPDTFSTKKNIFVAMAVGTLLMSDAAIIIAAIIDFKDANIDLTSFAVYVGPLCLQCIGFMKWSYCIWKINDIAQLVGILEKCHYLSMEINKNDVGWEKYKKEMASTRVHYVRFIYGWLSLCIYGILHWCSNPLIFELRENGFAISSSASLSSNGTNARTRYLPYLGWHPWDVYNNTGYLCMFFVQFIGGLGSAIGSIIYDVFYISSSMIICAQLRYLNNSLIDTESTSSILRTRETNRDFESKLKHCVEHHTEILTFLANLEILASPVMFVQCLENILVLCMVSLEASTIEVNSNLTTIIKLWSMLEYFLSVIAQLFVYCYYATEIRILGLEIANSVYLSDWEQIIYRNTESETTSKEDARRIHFLVEFFIMRSQKEILLTGGPFYVLSLETFKSVVGLAMSNSVILRQVVDDRG